MAPHCAILGSACPGSSSKVVPRWGLLMGKGGQGHG